MAEAAIELGTVGQPLREALGRIGREGEAAMLAVTGGVNTHRGAIWALGLLVAAAALEPGKAAAAALATRAARIALIDDRAAPRQDSHGSHVAQRYGARGAREEAQLGFPGVLLHGLPQLQRSRAQGSGEQNARLDALLAIMAELEDTCVLWRAGPEGLDAMQRAPARCSLPGLRQPRRTAPPARTGNLFAGAQCLAGRRGRSARRLFVHRPNRELTMETLSFEFPAGQPARGRALVGCVGSGDLEVLLEPGRAGTLAIQVITSVNGSEPRWAQLFQRLFAGQQLPALNIDIHDFGATPGGAPAPGAGPGGGGP